MRKIKPEFFFYSHCTTQGYMSPYLILKNDQYKMFQDPLNSSRVELLEDELLDDVHHDKHVFTMSPNKCFTLF